MATHVSLDTLPTEVLLLIIRFCARSQHLWRKEWDLNELAELQALCRASRRIRNLSLPALYKEVTLDESPTKIAAFLAAMHKAPHQAIHVRSLALYAPAGAYSAIFGADEMCDRPYGGPLGLSLFRNLTELQLSDDMVPVSIDPLLSQHDLFPALSQCAWFYTFCNLLMKIGVFQYGIREREMPDRNFPVTNLIPFWTAPNLQACHITGHQLRLISDSNTYCYGVESLSDIPELGMSCGIDSDALRALVAIRKPRSFTFIAPPNTLPYGCDFNHLTGSLAPYIKHLSYLWRDPWGDGPKQYPRISAFTLTTSMNLSAQVIADFAAESDDYEQLDLICNFPPCVKHLVVQVDSECIHRRQFYDIIADLVTRVLSGLSSLELGFMIAEIYPGDLYWNHRLVSRRESRSRGILPTGLYGTDGKTVEHNHLRDICYRAKTKLRAEYWQRLPDGGATMVSD